MKKLLALFFLLVATISFAAPTVTDWSKYWTERLSFLNDTIANINPLYSVTFTAPSTDKTLTITITTSDTSGFTKYDNISISAAIMRGLNIIKTYKGVTSIYIITGSYTRTVQVKDLLAPPKKQTLMSLTVLTDETQKKK
jgi:hypothetical protein